MLFVCYLAKQSVSRRLLTKVPFVKSEARADVAIVTEAEKNIYCETEENMKKELASKRDDW